MNIIHTEPAVAIATAGAIVSAALVLLVSFGVPITQQQTVAISTLAALIIPIAAGFLIRSQVSPVASLPVTPH
jgi:hypothetical protein